MLLALAFHLGSPYDLPAWRSLIPRVAKAWEPLAAGAGVPAGALPGAAGTRGAMGDRTGPKVRREARVKTVLQRLGAQSR